MEVMSYWRTYGSRRVRRSWSFTAPVGSGVLRRPPGSPSACALPATWRSTPPAATVGVGIDDPWADHHAHYLLNQRGQRIFVQKWTPWGSGSAGAGTFRRGRGRRAPRGRILLVHGLGDHSNQYKAVARAFVEAGYEVIAADHHGHGRSQGLRAYAADMRHYVDDASAVLDDAASRSPHGTLRTFVVGHSLGGAVAIHLARDRPPKQLGGVLLTAPAVQVYPNPILSALAPVIASVVPLLPVQPLRFERRTGYRVPRALRAHVPGFGGPAKEMKPKDPLVVRGSVRARTGMEVLKSCRRIMSSAHEFRAPVFVAHAMDDRVTNATGSEAFCNAIASKDKTLVQYTRGGHDLLARQRQVVVDMVEWCIRRS